MEKFKTVESRPAPLDSSNVDTDQIIPKQFLKRIERTGFGQFLFFDWRFNDDCFKNCILPIIVDEKHLNYLFNSSLNFDDYKVIVNLDEMTLSDNKGFSYKFNIDPYRRKCLLEGLDDISLTLMHEKKITLYENKFSK